MGNTVSVIMPAFNAAPFIHHAVASLFAQTHEDWELVLVGDDGFDYPALLAGQGLWDQRTRFISTGRTGAGASRARNLALDTLTTDYAALLDADDRFKPDKLQKVVAALGQAPIVSCALDVVTPDFTTLRRIADGPDRVLSAGQHKFVNFSMDTMLAWDRRACDARFDLELTNMTDLEFLLQLYRTAAESFHLGTPLQDYVKLPNSMSNGPGFTQKMIVAKTAMLDRLADGYYPMAEPGAVEGITEFLRLSLEAEASYPAKLAARPGLLFEDAFEPMIRAAGR